jgi:hypothetical protein
VATPCIDNHPLTERDFSTPGVLNTEAAKIVLKALYLAGVGRPEILWSVNDLAREVTKWNQACDKRLLRLMCYILCTRTWTHKALVGDPVSKCWLAMFADAGLAGDLRDSKSTIGSYLCLVEPNTFVPISWVCKKQGAISHSSTEAEVIALEASVRMEGIPALQLWQRVLELFDPKPEDQQNAVNQALPVKSVHHF